MLVEIADVVRTAPQVLVSCRTPIGRAVVRWRGDRSPVRGHCHVEWTVDRYSTLTRSATAAPAIGMDGALVVLRGRLRPEPDGVAVLDLGESFVLLEPTSRVPDGAWVEVRAPSGAVEIHPFDV